METLAMAYGANMKSTTFYSCRKTLILHQIQMKSAKSFIFDATIWRGKSGDCVCFVVVFFSIFRLNRLIICVLFKQSNAAAKLKCATHSMVPANNYKPATSQVVGQFTSTEKTWKSPNNSEIIGCMLHRYLGRQHTKYKIQINQFFFLSLSFLLCWDAVMAVHLFFFALSHL